MDPESIDASDEVMARRGRWVRVAILLSAILLIGWLVAWLDFWVQPQVGQAAGWRADFPDRAAKAGSYRRDAHRVLGAALAISVAAVVVGLVALLGGIRGWLTWRSALALAIAGLLLCTPVLLMAIDLDDLVVPLMPVQSGT